MEKAVTRRKWTAGLLITGTVALVVAFWSLIMSMLSLLAVAGVLTLLSLPLCKVLEKRLPGGAAAAIALLTLLGAVLGMLWGLIPPLLRQSALLMSRLPALLDSLRELLARWSAALEARGIPLGDMQAELFSRISAAAGQLAATLVSGIRRLTGSVSQCLRRCCRSTFCATASVFASCCRWFCPSNTVRAASVPPVKCAANPPCTCADS
mgnify:CR=1 FL=1